MLGVIAARCFTRDLSSELPQHGSNKICVREVVTEERSEDAIVLVLVRFATGVDCWTKKTYVAQRGHAMFADKE